MRVRNEGRAAAGGGYAVRVSVRLGKERLDVCLVQQRVQDESTLQELRLDVGAARQRVEARVTLAPLQRPFVREFGRVPPLHVRLYAREERAARGCVVRQHAQQVVAFAACLFLRIVVSAPGARYRAYVRRGYRRWLRGYRRALVDIHVGMRFADLTL